MYQTGQSGRDIFETIPATTDDGKGVRGRMVYSSTGLPWATPVVSGHLPCTATLSMSQHISTLNYLPSADTCLTRTRTVIYWLSVPAITDSASKYRVFGGHFNPKSLAARTLSCNRWFFQISMLQSGDRKQYFISRINACLMDHVTVASQTLWLHSFYDITS